MLTSADGLFWIAEQRRWREGVEVAQQDFEIFMKYVEQKL
jgi:hypothetical protein